MSIFASELVGSAGTIFGFEADPENAVPYAQRNDLSQIQVFSCVVWSSNGQLSFERASAESSRNQGSVAPTSDLTKKDIIVVEAISLDNFSKRHLAPTLIKIDVEGAEVDCSPRV